ncbi:hypothetical protein D0863_00010 [Hortaea werneckii]|uniref:NAD(P)-binding protein n=1 Tax=Hortaea werneckii TaxID=91943 RepID=A0A3M7ES54_HORWE|nr:hypothetical protein D0863_00010 [Hortaea werneckii]
MPPKLTFDAKEFGPSIGSILQIFQRTYNAWTNDTSQLAFSILGTSVAAISLLKLVRHLWGYVRPSKLQIYCHSETGSWALVTGASDGIGRGFVDELLSNGFNVLLHGRNQSKLEGIVKELAQKHPKRTIDFVIADASSNDSPELAVLEKVKSLPGKLTILPSLIMNCGSGAGVIGVPYITTYSGTKGYIHSFTKALKAEMAAEGFAPDKRSTKGVEVKGYIIGNTQSGGNKTDVPFFTISSAQCARGCLRQVGNGKTLETPHWRQEMIEWIASVIPEKTMRENMAQQMRDRKEQEAKEL